MKKLITTVLLLTLTVMCTGGAFVNVFAAGGVVIADSGVTEIQAKNYTAAGGTAADGGVGGAEFDNVSFQATEWVEYALSVQTEGWYNIKITYGAESSLSLAFNLNGTEAAAGNYEGTGGYRKYEDVNVAKIYLNSGDNTLRITNNSGSFYFRTVSFEFLKDIKTEEILTSNDKNILEPDVTVPRGCDSFTVKFNQKHDALSVTSETVKLMQGDAEIPVEIFSDGETVTVYLKKTLDFETEYTFVIDGVCDTFENSEVENESVSFLTTNETANSRDRVSSATLNVLGTVFEGRTIELSAEMISKAGKSIEGRIAELYHITPSGTLIETPLGSALSDSDGIATLNCELPEESESGVYQLFLTWEYCRERAGGIYIDMVYVTPEKEAELAETLKTAISNSEDDEAAVAVVSEFFEENHELLGLDLEGDMAELDASKVYAYFAENVPSSIDEIFNTYYQSIAMEKVNQAESGEDIQAVLADDKLCSYIGIIKEKTDLIINGQNDMADEIADLAEIRSDIQLKEAISAIVDKWYAKEYEKTDVTPSAEGMNINTGQAISIDLGFSQKVADVAGAIFVFEAEDGSIFEGCKVKTAAPFEAQYKTEGNKLIVTLSAEEGADSIESLGTLLLTNTEKAGSEEITVSGEIIYDVGTDYAAKAAILSKQIEVTITKNTNKGGGTVTARPSGTNKGGGSGVITQPEPTQSPEPTEEPEKYEFNDIDGVEWAKESIYSLLEDGVISESDDKKFNPGKNVTRAEFVKMIVLAFGLTDEAAECSLNDVEPDMWYYDVAASAQKQGLITGDENGNFNANDSITRQDMSAIVFRLCQKLGYGFEEDKFGEAFADDESISAYAKEAVYSMRIMGIINGVGDNMFAPTGNATRAQAAKVIYETVKAVGI